MTQVDSAQSNTLTQSISRYAAQIMTSGPVRFLGIGGDGDEMQSLADRAFGIRLASSRVINSLKGYMHGNTKKPEDASIDLLVVDAREHDIQRLPDSMRAAMLAAAPRARIALITTAEVLTCDAALPLRQMLTDRYSVTHIHVHEDATDGVIIWIGNASPSIKQAVVLSRGGAPTRPRHMISIPINAVRNTEDWSVIVPGDAAEDSHRAEQLGTYFDIRPGVNTPNDAVLIISATDIERLGLEPEAFRPVLPDPSLLEDEIIESRPGGFPDAEERLMILQIEPGTDLAAKFPNLHNHLMDKAPPDAGPSWYVLEHPPVPPIVCAARKDQPCCFFLNQSRAIATDRFVALYPKDGLADAIARNASLVARIWDEITKAVDAADEDITLQRLPEFEVPGLQQLMPVAS
ncbi:MAG: hypothetical protein DI537_17405 [Stutzerimonas stutzeri]|nr:MAG: hypothetical protein DI537_17405 [Stutzerimonas stutzeri]